MKKTYYTPLEIEIIVYAVEEGFAGSDLPLKHRGPGGGAGPDPDPYANPGESPTGVGPTGNTGDDGESNGGDDGLLGPE